MASIGRPKCGIWKFFTYSESSNTSKCSVTIQNDNSSEKICGKLLKGRYTTNLRKHLKSCHTQAYKELEAEEERKRETENKTVVTRKNMSHQLTLHNYSKYNERDKKQVALTHKLAVFIGANNQPLSLVHNEEFRELILEADPRFVIPHRQKLKVKIDEIFCDLQSKLLENMQHARKMCLCTDIWSRPGMTASFLGITCHYFNHNDLKQHNITLAVRHFSSPHTAHRVLEMFLSVIQKWNIQNSQIFRILSDNGSNMIAAFNTEVEMVEEPMEIVNTKENDITILEEMELIEDETDKDSDNLENIARRSSEEIQECERLEDEHHTAFFQYKRNSCVIHTLQLVVKIFETNPCFRSAIKKAKSIIKKVNKSTRATEKLIQLAKRKLRSDCPTRWDSTYLMLERLVEVKIHLNSVLDELEWDTLSSAQWKQIECILELLQPFAHYTNITSSEQTTSICMVLPLIKELSLHLEEVSKRK
jgi:hypothetical protein